MTQGRVLTNLLFNSFRGENFKYIPMRKNLMHIWHCDPPETCNSKSQLMDTKWFTAITNKDGSRFDYGATMWHSVLKIARMEVVMTFGVSFFKIMMCWVCDWLFVWSWFIATYNELILYTLTSVCIFSILFSIHFLKCWQGEFGWQSRISLTSNHCFLSWFLIEVILKREIRSWSLDIKRSKGLEILAYTIFAPL